VILVANKMKKANVIVILRVGVRSRPTEFNKEIRKWERHSGP
jgi:hypothetical protein